MNQTAYRTDIEGLRGIAILLVVLFHAGVRGFGGGFVGVDVFFVLSGFFITGPLVAELVTTGRLDIGAFYARRAQRILPLLFVVLLFALTVMSWLYAPIDRANIASTTTMVAFSAGNIGFAQRALNYFSAGENPLLHTWSLGVEQQFYLVWPLLLLLCVLRTHDVSTRVTRMGARLLWSLVAVVIVSLALSIWLTYASPAWAFFGLPTRLWEFALGGVIALLVAPPVHRDATAPAVDDAVAPARERVRWLQIAGLLAIAMAVVLYDRATPYPGVAALLPACGAAMLLLAGFAAPASTVGRVLSARPLQSLGRLSFAWYLWHWPLIGIGGMLARDIGAPGRLLWALAALGLAWVTHRVVETPARDGRLRIPRDWTLTAAVTASAVVALSAQFARGAAERASRSPEQRRFAAARNDRMRHDCWAGSERIPDAPCVFGDTASPRTMVLLGDSHAEHWLAGLDRAGRERGWRIVAMVKGGCPAADLSGLRNASLERRYGECARYRARTVERAIALRPAAVIVSSYDHYIPFDVPVPDPTEWQVSHAEWERGLRGTYARLTAAGLNTIVIRGTPRTWFDVPACLSRRAARLPFAAECTYPRDRAWSAAGTAAQNAAARGLPVQFLDMNDRICTAHSCEVERNGMVMFTDDNHLTASFTRSLAPELGRRIALLTGERLQASVLRMTR